jgi:hypothetical protein
MTKRAVDKGDEDQESWYEDAVERREELYRSGSTTFWDLTDLVKLWLEELHEVGLRALDPDLQAPPKQAEARRPERSLPWSNARPVHLESGQTIWLRFDGDRSERGYKSIRVSDQPLRTDAAIISALTVLEATPINKKELDFKIKRLSDLLRAHSEAPLEGALAERVAEIARELQADKTRERDLRFLEKGLHLRFFEFVLALLRARRPGFKDLPLEGQLKMLNRVSSYVNEISINSLKLMRFLEHGTPEGLRTRTLETANKRVEAAVLKDVVDLKHKEIADRLGIKAPTNYSIKKDYPEVRDLVKHGRILLKRALGEDGWRERVEAMKAEMQWWQGLSKEQRDAERWAEGMEYLIGPNPFGDIARRQAQGNDPNKGKSRLRYNPFADYR